jgi:catechol 2,3-dioxygenase-like lactoylglutathione lyase family enzyme
MTAQLFSLTFDASNPMGQARFWGTLLDREVVEHPRDGVLVAPSDETQIRLRFVPDEEQKSFPNKIHFDMTSESFDHMRETVRRALDLGARHIDVGQRPEEGHVVLADPDGNEFCVLPPGNNFTAGCGFIGALSCDGSQEVGYFWSEALGWPLVWDQDEETAIQSPRGGSKIAWGGTPLDPKPAKNRLHFDVAPPVGGDQQAEVERLIGLGAKRIDIGQGDVDWVVMADPDGNEFCVLTPR